MEPFQVELEHSPFICLALQHNAVPIVHRLRLHYTGESPSGPLCLRLQVGDGLSLTYEESLQLQPGQTWERAEPPLLLKAQELLATTETTRSYLLLEIFQDHQLLHQRHWPLEVLAYNHWAGLRGLPDQLCSFVLPHHPAVSQLVAEAGNFVAALDGYQSDQAYQQCQAIYQAVQELNIQYVQGSQSWEYGQKIRTPDQLIEHRQGNCLDLTCFMAAGLKRSGLHALLVLLEGHAFAGCWLRPEPDPDGPLSHVSTLNKSLALGLVCLFDSSSACSGLSFEEAEKVARGYLTEEKFQLALDLRVSEREGIRPLPLRLSLGGEVTLVHEQGTLARTQASIPSQQATSPGQDRPREIWERRLQAWKNRLLDLSTRNRLLDMRKDSNRRLLPLLLKQPQALLEELLKGTSYVLTGKPRLLSSSDPRSPQLAEIQSGQDLVLREVEDNFQQRFLQVDLEDSETLRRSLELYRADRVNLEETGSSTLFLALGSLSWLETEKSTLKRTAPVALLPVELVRVRLNEFYKLRWRGEDIRINLTLLRKLQVDYKIDLSDLESWPGSEGENPDLQALLQRLRAELLYREGWDLSEDCAIGSFSFAKLLMLSDLERFPDMDTAPLLRQFLTSQFTQPEAIVQPQNIDKERRPDQCNCVLDADSSQLAAIYSSLRGASFVLQGPPGTGKSQTITNMIAQNLAQGRSVLFVAEKLAALEVVYRRLQRQGLGPFCLQLHSNKASKGEILAQLRESLEYQPPPPARAATLSLPELQQELNQYVEELHRERPLGMSIYEAIGRCTELHPYREVECDLPTDFSQWDQVCSLSQELRLRYQEVGPWEQHPWKESRLANWQSDSSSRLRQRLIQGRQLLADWAELLDQPQNWGLSRSPQVEELAEFHRLLTLVRESPAPPDPLLDRNPWREIRALVDPALQLLEQRQQLWGQLAEDFGEDLLKLDVVSLRQHYQKWMSVFALGWLMLFSSRRKLRKVARRQLARAGQLIQQLGLAEQIQQLDQQLARYDSSLPELLGTPWKGPHSELSQVKNLVSWCQEFRPLWRELRQGSWSDQPVFFDRLRAACNQDESLMGAAGAWLERCQVQVGLLHQWFDDLQTEFQLNSPRRPLAEWSCWVEQRLLELNRLPDWCLFQEVCQKLEGLHLKPVVLALRQGQIAPEDIEGVLQRSALEAWLRQAVPLRFRGSLHQQKVEQFRELDQTRLHQARVELAQRLAERIPPLQDQGARGEMAVLQRELKKQRNLKAPRQLFKEVGNLLTRLKPCLLMSPLSIAQVLDPSNPPFDLVIFDEASQISPWDALGALARGRQWVVVGDSRQLPPTSFFATQAEDEEEDVDLGGTLESILDECSAAGLPQLSLNWHYRSCDERLIAFSNRHYYENRLFTFPNARRDSPALGVRMVSVEGGLFGRSGTRTNRIEAEALVSHLVETLRNSAERRSFGVVTFNQSQQTLVENLLDEARANFPEIERHFVDNLEPVFVKNLENVQGDERDVIYFSIAYAPDSQGKFRMEFGPLNRLGGERRLNVAVSRARQQMWVFTSIQPEQIDLNRAQALGARNLRAFLEYARRHGEFSNPSQEPSGDPLVRALQAELEARGWKVDTQLGTSDYRLDLAVRDPQRPGEYRCGLEWDGPHYRRAHSARDRDRLRQSVLTGLGWRLRRIWAPDWWRDPQRQMEELEQALNQEPSHSPEPPEVSAHLPTHNPSHESSHDSHESSHEPRHEPTHESSAPTQSFPQTEAQSHENVREGPDALQEPPALGRNWGPRPYIFCELEAQSLDCEPHKLSAPQFSRLALTLLETEAPLTQGYLFRRLLRALGGRQLGARIRSHFETLLGSLAAAGKLWIDESGTIWNSQAQSREFQGFRSGDRDLNEICPDELDSAIAYEMALCISLPESELTRAVARHFGKQKAGREVLLQRLQALLARGLLRRHQDNWVWLG